MSKKIFNPADWLENQPSSNASDQLSFLDDQSSDLDNQISDPENQASDKNILEFEVETIIQQLESKHLDITESYPDWVNLGFAIAEGFGESGRSYFHRISIFYPNYDKSECDNQYDKCLKSGKSGITIKSLFYKAKLAGVKINPETNVKSEDRSPTVPTFPDSLFTELPEFLKKVVCYTDSNEERDILLLGTLVCISACLPKVFGIYDKKRFYSNLFLYVTAQASTGKGKLVHCKQIVYPVHKDMRDLALSLKRQYDADLAEYNQSKGSQNGAEKPPKPPEKLLFIPANNSSTGAYQLLSDSDGKGLIFETEGDTLAYAFKSDYGNYSDGFRKAFQHETISYYRRTDREYVDILSPCLSACLSGTPQQIASLIPDVENGLFSRFIFYKMNMQFKWKDVFSSEFDQGLDEYFDQLGQEFFSLYKILQSGPYIQCMLTEDQKSRFNDFFATVQDQYLDLVGKDYMASIRRLGLITFRISMILTTLRLMESGEQSTILICEERDFNTSIQMAKVLVKHAVSVFSQLPEVAKPTIRKNKKQQFLELLPSKFNRQKYIEVAIVLKIEPKTAEGYITAFVKTGLIHRDMQDHYEKC